MQFTRFLLDNYLATTEGAQALSFFQNLPKYVADGDPDNKIAKFTNDLLLLPLAEDFFVAKRDISDDGWESVSYRDFDDFAGDVASFFHEEASKPGENYRNLVEEIPSISVYLYAESQQFAFPYFYPVHFFRIQEICDTFGILIPPLPGKTKYEDKCLYYILLCKVFFEFRQHHQMTPEEFCVFFYCFARHFISNPLTEEMPKPLKVYISGANPENDHAYLQTISSTSVHYWQGNAETQPGDIILVYELAPQSHISSIWRAIAPGYDDPFRYYPGVIWVGHPVKIPRISLDDLKANAVWAQKGLIRANMQGVSGRACSREEYAALLAMLEQKHFDISLLPPLPQIATSVDFALSNERDVEKYLLEPFLKQLGLAEKDWIRQMPLRMGRGIRYYPDYVIHADTTRGDERGTLICEAKFRIPNKRQLKEDFHQAKSYALRLGCKGLVLASCEGIWLSFSQDAYSFEKLSTVSWDELRHPDTLHKIKTKLETLLRKNAP